jgi:hypothetical protein
MLALRRFFGLTEGPTLKRAGQIYTHALGNMGARTLQSICGTCPHKPDSPTDSGTSLITACGIMNDRERSRPEKIPGPQRMCNRTA